MGGNTTISTSDPRIGNIPVQSSAYGLVIPLIYGRARVPGNLGWYGNFNAIPITTVDDAGGKGGGGVSQSRTTYKYEAAAIMFLGHGPLNGVPSAWRGKERLFGETVAARVRTLKHFVVVPGGGVVTVPEAAIFKAAVQVDTNDIPVSGWGYDGGFAVMQEGTDYTHVGGDYTFHAGWIGRYVNITYQVENAEATLSALGQLGLSLATGTTAQPVWSWLQSYNPSEALSYSGIAYVYAQNYALDDSARLPNHNFEVSTPWERPDLSTLDAHPADILEDLLRDPIRGVDWSSDGLASLDHYRAYCTALGLFMSPVLDTQRPALEWIKSLLELTNADVVYSGSQIKIVPLGDENATGNGVTFVANTTPAYDLTIDDFVTTGGGPRVRIRRNGNDDVRGAQGSDSARNVITLEIENRENNYALEPVSAEDLASAEEFGRNPADTVSATAIKSVAVGRRVAQLKLQKEQGRRAQYEFTLWANRGLLEPLDLLTLTDADLGLDRVPVRLLSIDERDDQTFDAVAEDAPIGMASAPEYGTQAGDGFFHDYNVAPGDVLASPVIFELPGEFSNTGLELAVAAAGGSADWGGCDVWVSYDGSNYKRIGAISGASRYGALTAGISSDAFSVSINGGQLLSGSATDLSALSTLCYIGGASPEFLAYQTATLTGANAYTLSTLNRAAYGSVASTHSISDPFVRVDGAIARSGPLDPALVGQTVHVKLTSFNLFGGGRQSLADVSAYTHVITGEWVYGNAGAAALLGISSAVSDDILSPGEKPPVVLDYTNVIAEQAGIDAQATSYGITTEKTAYDNAVTALTAYLATLTTPTAWNNLSGNTAISGATFRSTWATLYAARQTLLNKIAAVAGTVASWGGVSGAGKPASYATVGKSLGLPFESWALNGQALVTVSDGKVGSTVLRLSGISAAYPNQNNLVPIDRTKTYRTRFWARPSADNASGFLYFSLYQFISPGVGGPINGGRAPYKPSAITRAAHNSQFGGTDQWGEYSFTWGAADWQTGVQFVLPEFLDNYPSATGHWDIQDFTFEEVTEVTLAKSAADAAAAAAAAANASLAEISSDSLLTPDEKPRVIMDRDVIVAEQSDIDAKATAQGITTLKTAYDTSVSDLTTYLATLTSPTLWYDLGGNTVINGTVFRNTFAAVYAARQALMNKIAVTIAAGAVGTTEVATGGINTVNMADNAATVPAGAKLATDTVVGTGSYSTFASVTISPSAPVFVIAHSNIQIASGATANYHVVARIGNGSGGDRVASSLTLRASAGATEYETMTLSFYDSSTAAGARTYTLEMVCDTASKAKAMADATTIFAIGTRK